ncbi:mor transcription activator family protein [Mannheimia haemolytica]|uniref:mor transcription activator family protein n=1 Tax=Mannheimia haemolytica TaxID=75985 RepID=UPI003209E9AF
MAEFERVEHYLPESVKEIVDLIGLSATEKLIKAFGGFSFQFSKGKVYFEKLKDVLGEEDAEKLYDYLRSNIAYLPRCQTALRLLRNERIYTDYCRMTEQEGISGRLAIMQICSKYGVSDRIAWDAVRYLKSKPKQPITQTSLF